MASERYVQPEAFEFQAEFNEGEEEFGSFETSAFETNTSETGVFETGAFETDEFGAGEFGAGELSFGEQEGAFGETSFGEAEFAFVGEVPTAWELEREGVEAPATCPPKPKFIDCPPRGTRPNHILDNFTFDRSDVNRVCHTLLINEAADRIIQSQASTRPIKNLLIAGHTDAVGDDNYNFGLARRRAEAVLLALCKALESKRPGITRTIEFRLTSCGERQTKATPALSRRVEIFLPAPPQPAGCPPFKERIRLHLKILVQPKRFTIARMLRSMRQVYEPKGFLIEVVSCEVISAPALEVLDIRCPGTTQACCPFPCATNTLNQEHIDLFANRNNVEANELAVYFVRLMQPGFRGCCAHPVGRPGVVVASTASEWTLGHEIGHTLGLAHVDVNNRLMIGPALGGTNALPTAPPPVLTPAEVTTMLNSALTVPC